MRKKLSDAESLSFQSYLSNTLNSDIVIKELSDSDFNILYDKYLSSEHYKSFLNLKDNIVVSLSKNSDLSSIEEDTEKSLDDYLMEMDIYVDLNNLSPEALKKILIASEKKFKEADDAYEKSNEMLDESIKYLEDSQKHLDEAHNLLLGKKSKPKDSKYSFGKLVHTIYDDSKTLFGYGALAFVAFAIFAGTGDDYKEEDKVLTYAIEENAFFDKAEQANYLENDVEISLNKLGTFYEDVNYILDKGYDKDADKDYLKSIYIKSIIVNESLDSLNISDSDFKSNLNKLITELESDLDIKSDK